MSRRYLCGIDIGTVNMGICFYSCDRIVGYRGSCKKILRYEQNNPVNELKCEEESDCASLVKLLNLIPEFENTVTIRIEKQCSFHNNEVIRLDGVVFGFLMGKFPNIETKYMSPNSRISFVNKILKERPECLLAELPKKKYRDAKIPSLQIVYTLFNPFYEYLLLNMGDEKMDDICDSLIYAIFPIYGTVMF